MAWVEAHHTSKDGKADEVLLSAVESLDEKISGKSCSKKRRFSVRMPFF